MSERPADEIDRAGLAALVAGSGDTGSGSGRDTGRGTRRDPGGDTGRGRGRDPGGDVGADVHVAAATPVGGVRILEGVRAARPHRWRRRIGRTAVLVVLLGAVYYAVTLFQVWAVGRSDQARPVDAIVVMGAAQYDGRPSPVLQARLDHALELWQQGLAPTVVVTGGRMPGDRFTEAEASAAYLVERGVPATSILQETAARNSYDSLVGVRDLVRDRGLQRVLLVSDPFHSLRIRLIAEELGLTAYVSPTRSSPVQGSSLVLRELKEAAGISVARIIGFDRLLSITG